MRDDVLIERVERLTRLCADLRAEIRRESEMLTRIEQELKAISPRRLEPDEVLIGRVYH